MLWSVICANKKIFKIFKTFLPKLKVSQNGTPGRAEQYTCLARRSGEITATESGATWREYYHGSGRLKT